MSLIKHELNGQYSRTGYEGEQWKDEWQKPPLQNSGLLNRLFRHKPVSNWESGMLDQEERFGVSSDSPAVNTTRPFYSALIDKLLERFF